MCDNCGRYGKKTIGKLVYSFYSTSFEVMDEKADEHLYESLLKAVSNNDVDGVMEAIKEGANLKRKDKVLIRLLFF